MITNVLPPFFMVHSVLLTTLDLQYGFPYRTGNNSAGFRTQVYATWLTRSRTGISAVTVRVRVL